MKIIHIAGLAVTGLILASSCSKQYLDKSDPTKVGTELFYKDAKQVEQAVNGVYGTLQGLTNNAWLLFEQITDNTTIDLNPADRGGAGSTETFEFFNVNSGNGYIQDYYSGAYNSIYNINIALQKMQGGELSEEDRLLNEGQLKFIRAYVYFELVQAFGEVIVITEPLADPQLSYDYARKPVDTAYALIIQDLNDAVAGLPESYPAEGIGRATKGAALTLLGKVHLTRKEYPEAQEALSQVLSLGYSLVPNYADIFDPEKKNGPESIFDVQYQGGNDQGEWSGFVYWMAPRISEGFVTGWPQSSPAGFNIPTNDIINTYEPDDKRKEASIGLDFNSPVTGELIPYTKKYAHPHTIYNRTDDNWPVLRYSDALLMLAEAINEQSGPNGDAYTYINDVRDRAGLPPVAGLDQSKFRDTLMHERRIELAFENWRWFDLKRTKTTAELAAFMNAYGAKEKANPTVQRQGVPFSTLDYVFDEFEALLPIPNREILTNSSLVQNPGY